MSTWLDDFVKYLPYAIIAINEILANGTPSDFPNSVGEALTWLVMAIVRAVKPKKEKPTPEKKPPITLDDLDV